MKVLSIGLTAFFLMIRVVLGGTTIEWTGGGGNANWVTPGNWNPAQVPLTNDTAVFLSGSNNVTLNIDITNNVVLNAGALLVARVPDKTTKNLFGSLSGDGRLVVTGNLNNGGDVEILKVSHRNVTHTGGTELQNAGEINFYPGQLDSWFGTTNIVLRRGIFKVDGINVPAADASLYPQNPAAPYIVCRNTVEVEEEGGTYGMVGGSGNNDNGRFFGPVILVFRAISPLIYYRDLVYYAA
jgi:hypothetical protein